MNNIVDMMLRRKNMIYIPGSENKELTQQILEEMKNNDPELYEKRKMYVTVLNMDMQSLGFKLSPAAFNAVMNATETELDHIYRDTIDSLKAIRGADVNYRPFWPGFPDQTADMSNIDRYFAAILHYLSGGTIVPADNIDRSRPLPSVDFHTPKEVGVGNDEDLEVLLSTLLNQSISYSHNDKEDLKNLLEYENGHNRRGFMRLLSKHIPEDFINKENLATSTALSINVNKNTFAIFESKYKTATDVLRFLCAVSDADPSLKGVEGVKFRNLSKAETRAILKILNKCNGIKEDFQRYESVWKRILSHAHVFDYDMSPEAIKRKTDVALSKGRVYKPKITVNEYNKNYSKIVEASRLLMEDRLPQNFASKVESLIAKKEWYQAANLLSKRPGEFGRRLDQLLRECPDPEAEDILGLYSKVAHNMAPTVLISIYTHFNKEGHEPIRTFMPKGNSAKIFNVVNEKDDIPEEYKKRIVEITRDALKDIYKEKGSLGKVYIADDAKKYKAPMVLRNASDSSKLIPRGSRIDVSKENNVERTFIWWTNKKNDVVDIDLSAAFFDKNWNMVSRISYYDLSNRYGQHSGDYTNGGPENGNGVAEFIDIDINKCKKSGIKYIAYTVQNFTGYSFDETPCRFGWMDRNEVKDRAVFEPKSVRNAAHLTAKTTACIPAVYDVENKEMIWADLTVKGVEFGPNNVDGTLSQNIAATYAIVNNNYMDLKDLIEINASVRGEMVDDPNKADLIICDNPALLNLEDKEANETKKDPVIIEVSDLSAINALFINPTKDVDKDLLPVLEEEKQDEREMTEMDYINKLNQLKSEMREVREAIYKEYGDHTDDADLCWSQRRESYDQEIDYLVEEAEEAGTPVWYDSEKREWVIKEMSLDEILNYLKEKNDEDRERNGGLNNVVRAIQEDAR